MAGPDEAIPVRARVRGGAARPPVLEVDYDGSAPPEPLLADLRALGWEDVRPEPPPSSAIDWSRPDPTRGTRHSVRPFPARIHGTLGPGVDVGAIAARTAAVLARHGLHDAPTAAAPSPPIGPGTPATVPAAAGRSRREADQPPGPRLVDVVVDAALAAVTRAQLAGVAEVVEAVEETWTTSVSFRGQQAELHHPVQRLRLAVPHAAYGELLGVLARHPVRAVRPAEG
ncbi:MAG: hypothetical protein AB7L84_08250 [Acidimicrobiia bacterium]